VANTGSARNAAAAVCAAIAVAALALVSKIAVHGPRPSAASGSGSMRSSGAMMTS